MELCGCIRCREERGEELYWFGTMIEMVCCNQCGNKRCPHSDDHNNPCSWNNEPGQLGSRYK